MKKNKKGFTLIELLAVILILAIVALIAIPVVTNIINDAKKHALKDSAYGIIDSADLYYAKNMKSITTNLEFTCSNNKCEASTNKLDFKGEVREGKVKLFNDGKVSICIENETYAAYKNAATDEVTVAKGTCNYSGDEYTVDELVSLSDFNDMKAQYEAQIAQLQSTSNITIKSHNTYSQSSTPWSNSQTLTLTSENNKEYMLIVYATAINSGEPTRSENITLTLSGCTTKEVIRNDNNIKIYKVKANSNEISILFSYATSNVIRLEAELI